MKNKRQKKNKTPLIRSLCMAVFIVTVTSVICVQIKKTCAIENEIAIVTKQLDEEKARNEKLKKQGEYYKSDEYIEQMAREKFGYVKPNEIVFKNKNSSVSN